MGGKLCGQFLIASANQDELERGIGSVEAAGDVVHYLGAVTAE